MINARVQHILVGALAGLALWVLFDVLDELRSGRLVLGLTVLALAFFGAALAMLGDLGWRRALGGAVAVAVPAAALALLKSWGFETADQMLEARHPLIALLAVAVLPVPFVLAAGLGGRGGWSDYRVLFLESWNIVVRYAAAWLFVGVVWLVLFLSAQLLQLVGVSALERLIEQPATVWIVSGAVLGLGLSVVNELSDMVSPYLLLRLLRLLVPVVLAVVTVFILALPLRGLTHLFGHLSAAGTLLATALGAISLISIAVDQDDVEAVHTAVLRWSARGLALTLPVLGGLAVWAIVLRVRQYGWTPERVTAAALAAVVLGYALGYALAVLTGRGWMGWIRRVNVAMALGMIGLGAVWLTPLIAPEAWAVRSQLARYDDGRLAPEALPLWQMAHDWGKPGLRALEGLRVTAEGEGQQVLAAQLKKLDAAETRWEMDPAQPPVPALQADALRAAMVVRPEGHELPSDLVEFLVRFLGEAGVRDCAGPADLTATPELAPDTPACLLVFADLWPHDAGEEALLIRGDKAGYLPVALSLRARATGWDTGGPVEPLQGGALAGPALIAQILAQGVTLVPAGLMALQVGNQRFTIIP